MINDIIKYDVIDTNTSFNIAGNCAKYLRDIDTKDIARKIIIHVLNNWNKIDETTSELWTDLIESAGFYPYLQKEKLNLCQTSGRIRMEYHKSDNISGIYLHEEQKVILDFLNMNKNIIVSAPTSFGKSLLIEEIVASKKYRNIVVIQPTLALLDETRKKLKKYNDDYKIIVKSSQDFSLQKGNLFLLTAERVMEYKNLPRIDFLVLDEFYKLSSERDDERSDVLNNAFNLLANKYKCSFYLLGPNIDGISKGFAQKYNAEFYKTQYNLVESQMINIYDDLDNSGTSKEKKMNKERTLFELLLKLKDEQTIIYCSSPSKVRYLSYQFLNFLVTHKQQNNVQISLTKWIENNINKNWSLIKCLNSAIGIHDGALQKHITSSIIDYFNAGKLKYLFCTTTIIEGVNTSSKNVVYFDKTKGNRIPIDYFDYCNIKGRSGRMMIHYIGNIYNFNKPPEQEKIIIDIPFFEQNDNISPEILIHIDENDIKNKSSEQYTLIHSLSEFEKEIFKNNGVIIKGQIDILNQLERVIFDKYHLICWKRYPSYNQLEFILGLAWNNLLKPGETTRPMTLKKLVRVTSDYVHNKNINYLIKSNYNYFKESNKYNSDQERLDEAIRDAFQILRHWFQYKVPKWINVINELQSYVCNKHDLEPGDYCFYSSEIENDFIRKNLSILIEYGIPKSAINKIKNAIPDSCNEDEVIEFIKNKELYNNEGLIQYEREKIINSII